MAGTEPTITCPSCSVAVTSSARRCPECGHWIPTELSSRLPKRESQRAAGAAGSSAPPQKAPSTLPPVSPSAMRPLPPSILRAAWPWLGAGAAIVLAFVWLRPRSSTDAARSRAAHVAAVAPPPAASAQPEAPVPRADDLDLEAALARATSKALAWHRDAELLEITVTDVVGGKITAGGAGSIQIRFGTPPAGRRVGPGAHVGTDQIMVRIDERGDRAEPVRGPAARSVAPPVCGFDRAWRAMVASGVPPGDPVTMRFALDKRGDRAVWTAQPVGSREPTRTLDGSSCAVLLRR
jgi:hypothetical protein